MRGVAKTELSGAGCLLTYKIIGLAEIRPKKSCLAESRCFLTYDWRKFGQAPGPVPTLSHWNATAALFHSKHKSVHSSLKKLRAKQLQQLRWLASMPLEPSCSPLPSTVARASRPVLYGVTAAVWESSWKVLLSRLPLRHNLAGCRGQQRWPYRRRSFLLSYAPHVGQLSLLPAALNRGVAPRVSLAVRSAFSSTICRMRLHRNRASPPPVPQAM